MTTNRAKIFRNGGSQAVRLPRAYSFADDQEEVMVVRDGRRIILEPLDEWPDAFIRCLGAWSEAIERPPQTPVAELEDPFE
jgi:antitoxin VapB